MHTGSEKSGWMAIVNPKAGKGKGLDDWPQISNSLNNEGVEFSCVFTEFKYHAIELTVKAIKDGYRNILAIGGDGCINEVVNGIFMQQEVPVEQITFAIIPVGNGNDFGRMLGLSKAYKMAIKMVARKKVMKTDLIRAEYYESKVHHTRYVVNSSGIGMDAIVIKNYDYLRYFGYKGRLLYLLSIFFAFHAYRFRSYRIVVDGTEVYDGPIYSLCVGNGKYKGCGLKMSREAEIDDGLLDVSFIKRVSKFRALFHVGQISNGKIFDNYSLAGYHKGKVIEVTPRSERPISYLESDGELLSQGPYRFTIMPKALNIVSGL